MKTTLKIAALFSAATLVVGCNTMRGFGEDLQAAGGAISGTAKRDEKKSAPASATAAPAPAPAPATSGPAPAPQQPTRR
jgi:predicted small secreted protein